MLYLKSEDFIRANALIDDSLFPVKEKKILAAGCKFAAGKMEEAYKIVKEATNSIKEEEEEEKEILLVSLDIDEDKKTDLKSEQKEQDNNEMKIDTKEDSKVELKSDDKDDNNNDTIMFILLIN
jgi:hypothetical protein